MRQRPARAWPLGNASRSHRTVRLSRCWIRRRASVLRRPFLRKLPVIGLPTGTLTISRKGRCNAQHTDEYIRSPRNDFIALLECQPGVDHEPCGAHNGGPSDNPGYWAPYDEPADDGCRDPGADRDDPLQLVGPEDDGQDHGDHSSREPD